jgi:uroporphyrinogen-III synthase
VAALGRTPVLLPLLEISPLPEEGQGELRRVLADLPTMRWWPSCRRMRSRPRLPCIDAWPQGVDIAVVGEGSRAALAKHGVTR